MWRLKSPSFRKSFTENCKHCQYREFDLKIIQHIHRKFCVLAKIQLKKETFPEYYCKKKKKMAYLRYYVCNVHIEAVYTCASVLYE